MWYRGAGGGALSLILRLGHLSDKTNFPELLGGLKEMLHVLGMETFPTDSNSYSHAFLKHKFVFTMRNSIYVWHSN